MKDVERTTKGDHQSFLVKFLQTPRREFTQSEFDTTAANGRGEVLVNMVDIEKDADAMHDIAKGYVFTWFVFKRLKITA